MLRIIIALLTLLYGSAAFAQGVIPVALAQQSDANGRPLSGALLYIYQVGTVATPQNSFQDFGLTLINPWPLPADSTGRIPMFYLANGQVHVRLTDSTGVVIFDIPNMQVVGPSSGSGGGGGPGVDPTTIASTGDIKYRMTGEVLTGWVKVNGQSIGSASCIGCTGRTNADTQNLYTYLWANCTDAHCQVVGGRGATALADFMSNKPITLPDLRGRMLVGLDDMGAMAVGRIANSNITSGGGDLPTTPAATGGEANHTLTVAELANHNHALTDPGHKHTITSFRSAQITNTTANVAGWLAAPPTTSQSTDVGAGTFGGDVGGTGISIAAAGSGTAHNTMAPFALGSWYIRL
jgi:microcystin-dependent protein